MSWLKALAINVIALALAAGVGTILISQVIYIYKIPTGAVPIAPLIKGFLVSVVVAALAPRTSFPARIFVFIGIYFLEISLSIIAAAISIEIVNYYFDGNREAARPWTYFGAITPFIAGATGYYILRLCRSQSPG